MGGSRYIAAGLGATGFMAALMLVLFRPLGAPAIAQENSPTYVGVATCGGTLESCTRTVNVKVPVCVRKPTQQPFGPMVMPGGGVPAEML